MLSYAHMELSRDTWVKWGGAVLATVLVVGAWAWYQSTQVPGFPVNEKDSLSSWSFQGAYTGNEMLVEKAEADIEKLQGLLGEEGYDDYDLYIGIGNDFALLGDGAKAYENYNRAVAVAADRGLAYTNIASLMERMQAYETAADAYAQAVTAEPGQLQYHIARLNYLTRQFRDDPDRVLEAVADAGAEFGDIPQILSIQAEWYTGLARYADAIAVWKQVRALLQGEDTSSIDAEIARLRAKQ